MEGSAEVHSQPWQCLPAARFRRPQGSRQCGRSVGVTIPTPRACGRRRRAYDPVEAFVRIQTVCGRTQEIDERSLKRSSLGFRLRTHPSETNRFQAVCSHSANWKGISGPASGTSGLSSASKITGKQNGEDTTEGKCGLAAGLEQAEESRTSCLHGRSQRMSKTRLQGYDSSDR